ncbi:GGDEF domain-containing protein [Acinetobacter sp. MB5]|uniref:GGDEF domain-containing protein n=1 Tax=Acinetobacter sp. MB5 TaxID=2069438 RepID=UPI000DD098A5|nr:GGDEF domain-containing protein [Acinetobacter sp. MB5]
MFNLPECNNEIIISAMQELERRAFISAFIYLPCWLIIALNNQNNIFIQETYYPICFFFLIILFLHIILHYRFNQILQNNFHRARLLLTIIIIIPCLMLGSICSWCIYLHVSYNITVPFIIITAVLCTATSLLLTIDPIYKIMVPLAMLLPALTSVLVERSSDNLIFLPLAALNILYIFRSSQLKFHDYWHALITFSYFKQKSMTLENMAFTDFLTQKPNRLCADKQLKSLWEQAKTEQQCLAWMIIDIDNFKNINDSYGHPFGDICLMLVADALASYSRKVGGFFARYGGEEFVFIKICESGTEIHQMAQGLMQQSSKTRICHDDASINITYSIGVSSLCPNLTEQTSNDLIAQADQALYIAKHEGKNQYRCYGETHPYIEQQMQMLNTQSTCCSIPCEKQDNQCPPA